MVALFVGRALRFQPKETIISPMEKLLDHNRIKKARAKEMGVQILDKFVILGVPRSGTSWLNEILNSHPEIRSLYQPLHSYTFPLGHQELESDSRLEGLFSSLLSSDDPFINMKIGSGKSDYNFTAEPNLRAIGFKETHFLQEILNAVERVDFFRAICIVRDPRETLRSWLNHPREFTEHEKFEEVWKSGGVRNTREGNYFGFDAWLNFLNMALKLRDTDPSKICFVSYHNLKKNGEVEIRKVLEFLNTNWAPEVGEYLYSSAIKEQKSLDSVGVRDLNYNELDPKIYKQITDLLERTGVGEFINEL